MLYADGIAVCEKPCKSIWPVFAELLDLHPSIRASKNNKIISGVWYGGSPTSDILFSSLFEDLRSIESSGLVIEIGNKKIQFQIVQIFVNFLSSVS